jgi:toxin ParE1/3/4
MRHVFRSPQARADLLEISAFIAGDSAASSSRFFDAAERCFRQLSRFPELGTVAEFSSFHLHGLRRWRIKGFENYLVFYRPVEDGVEIVRVLHGARDVETLFGET